MTGTLHYYENDVSALCEYRGTLNGPTIKFYDLADDCANDVNAIREVTLPVECFVSLRPDRNLDILGVVAGVSGNNDLFRFDNAKVGAGVQFARTGETLSGLANGTDCDDIIIPLGNGGTASITIPAHGS
jgi:hypothetical protein